MARKMLVWDEGYQGNNDSSFSNNDGSDSDKYDDDVDDNMMPLPRWHPIAGISDENPSFRKKPPAMNSMGYAGSIRRNSRKRNSSSMWNYALRTYRRVRHTQSTIIVSLFLTCTYYTIQIIIPDGRDYSNKIQWKV